MKLGVQYYRDPNPPESCWAQDLADLASAGFAYIGCWIPWRYVNPKKGEWDLAKYRRLFELAHQQGLQVRVQLVPESAPDWAARKYPDALLVNANGQSVYLHPHPMLQLGGWPGLSAFHPEIRTLIDAYYREVITRLKDLSAIATWNIWNELNAVPSYDPFTQEAYWAWIRRRYATIEDYNLARHTRHIAFHELTIPNPVIETTMTLSRAADEAEFRRDVTLQEAEHRARLVREADPSRPVSAHTNSNSPFHMSKDDWGVAEHVQIYGNSTYNPDVFFDAMSCIKQRSVCGPGRWWLTEHCGGRMIYYYGHRTFSGDRLADDVLAALAHGAAAACFWQYRCERVEQEAPNFGLLNPDGSRSKRFESLASLASALNSWNAEDLQYDPPEIALLVEPLDLVFRGASDGWEKQVWQEYREFEHWLLALLNLGYSPHFLPAWRLPQHPIPSSIKIIVAPSLVVLREGVAERLIQWVDRGGMLIGGPFAGVFNPDGWTFPTIPGSGLDMLFGLHVVDRINGDLFPLSDSDSTPSILNGRYLFEQVAPAPKTEVLLTWQNQPAITRNRHGKGWSLYSATFLGADYETHESPLGEWLNDLLWTIGIRPPIETEDLLWQNAAWRGKNRILFLRNPTAQSVKVSVSLPDQASLKGVVSGIQFSGSGSASIPFMPFQTRMLILSSSDSQT